MCAGVKRAAVYQPGSNASGEQPHQGNLDLGVIVNTTRDSNSSVTQHYCCLK